MAVSTADIAIKDDFPRELGEAAGIAVVGLDAGDEADEEYRRDVREIYEESRDMLLKKTITKKEFDNIMMKCRDREFAKEVAERNRELNRLFAEGEALALKYGITEEDVNEAIREVREEKRAERERAGSK